MKEYVYMVVLDLSVKGTFIGKWKSLNNIFTTEILAQECLDKKTDPFFPLVIRKIEVDKVQ